MTVPHFQFWCRLLGLAWIGAVIVVSLQTTGGDNTFEIYRTASRNLLAGHDLYAANAAHHDYFDYSPTFAVLFIPFAIVPAALGLLLWNGLNAGTLYWSLGRLLSGEQAFVARAVVFLDTVGSMQSRQSNALCAGLIILTFTELRRRRAVGAAASVAIGTFVKVFPLAAAAFALFQPARILRFAGLTLAFGVLLALAPLIVLSPGELVEQYRSWIARQPTVASVEYSVMDQARIWFGVDWPYWPLQLAGAVAVVAPFLRAAARDPGNEGFRTLGLASVLLFCVLFNHKAESPTFVIAAAGIGIWFATSPRDRFSRAVLVVLALFTVLPSSDAVPWPIQRSFFEPYRIKTLPVLALWLLIQGQLWRQRGPVPLPVRESDRVAPAT